MRKNIKWIKYPEPVLKSLGTVFDVSVLKENDVFRMWFSWKPMKSIAVSESVDGINWSYPKIALTPNFNATWEDDVNRPNVIKREKTYFLWYTGQARCRSYIGLAKSNNGTEWIRIDKPVLIPDNCWEKAAVMSPHVIWDEKQQLYCMWYSGGDQYEPNAIGYATSVDGQHWNKFEKNPIFTSSNLDWEKFKVAGPQVIKKDDFYYMFYIGYTDEDHGKIGLARSKDGITLWERYPDNPIILPSKNSWDEDAVYKSFAIFDDMHWMLWYNGRKGDLEQIGLATLESSELWI
jgi:predicted GH43/DUF377 family glycosyl hydrolase